MFVCYSILMQHEEHKLPIIGEEARTGEFKKQRSLLIEMTRTLHNLLAEHNGEDHDKPDVMVKNLPGGVKGMIAVTFRQEAYVFYEQGGGYDSSENEDVIAEFGREPLGLCAFPRALNSKENEIHRND